MSQDSELEKYLRGKTGVSQLYADAPQVGSPDHLDAAILAEAHRAVGARPGAPAKRRWAIPLGLAASLFLVVMAGLQLPYLLKDAAMTQSPMAARIPAAKESGMAVPSSSAPAERMKLQDMDKASAEAMRGEPATLAAQAYARKDAPVAASPAPAVAAKPLEAGARADVGNGVALAKEKKADGFAAGNLSDSLEQRAPAAARMAAPQPVQLERAQGLLLQEKDNEASLRPEDWLNRIMRLKQQGKLDEAKKDLAAFKKRYPDYPVPEALELR